MGNHFQTVQTEQASNIKHGSQNFLRGEDGRKDKSRGRSLVFVDVVNRCTDWLMLPSGFSITPGKHRIEIYEDEVAAVMLRVEPAPEKIEQARQAYILSVVELMTEKYLSNEENPCRDEADPLAALAELIIADKAKGVVADALKRVLSETPHSVEGEFRKANKRDILPLVSAVLVPNSEHAEPQREEMKRELDQATTAQAQALTAALIAAAPAIAAAMSAHNAAPAAPAQTGTTSQGGQRRG